MCLGSWGKRCERSAGVIVPEPNGDELGAKEKSLNCFQWEVATDRLMEHVVGFGEAISLLGTRVFSVYVFA
jgi:hypothetical protein